MELKFVIPNMEKTFGNLEFAGEDKTEQRKINGRIAVLSRSFNLCFAVYVRTGGLAGIILPVMLCTYVRRIYPRSLLL